MSKKVFTAAFVFLSAMILAFLLPRKAAADGSVQINEGNFPDQVFRSWVAENCDPDGNGELSTAELSAVTYVNVSQKNISNLKGIEHFSNLESLSCNGDYMRNLDVSKNLKLTSLDCSDNQLSTLNVTKNTALTHLSCYDNMLTALNVTKNTALVRLDCSGNNIQTLDVTKNTALTGLYCSSAGLSTLNIANNTLLKILACSGNNLSKLDVTKQTALKELYCDSNRLTSLDLSRNTALTDLDCSVNRLTALDLTKNLQLRNLACSSNDLEKLNLTKNTGLRMLSCIGNQLTKLDLSKNTSLSRVECEDNRLTKLDLGANSELEWLHCEYNSLDLVDFSECPKLRQIYQSSSVVNIDGVMYVNRVHIDLIDEDYWDISYDAASTAVAENPFTDVKKTDSFFGAVMWAVSNGITRGTTSSTFSPHSDCTRYQFAVMLFKLAASPATGYQAPPFTDVLPGDSYYTAVAWAYQNGIISGTTATTFSPQNTVTRYQVVQMLYKLAGKPSVSGISNPFKDVTPKNSYYKAVLWAYSNKITSGTSATTFSPNAACQRYQMVVFLKKFNKIYGYK